MFAGTVFTFGYNLIGALQRGLGNAAASMSFVIISSAANIALDAVFIVWLGMGAFGAALGTVLFSGGGIRHRHRTVRKGRERRCAFRQGQCASIKSI